MNIHENARSCLKSRVLLVDRVTKRGWSVKAAAAAAGLSERRSYEYLRRFREGSYQALQDRSSRPHRSTGKIPDGCAEKIIEHRRDLLTFDQIGSRVGRSRSTVHRVLQRAGLNRRSSLGSPPPVPQRYEWSEPGEMLHVDTKKLARIVNGPGHRVTDYPSNQRRTTRRVGWEFLHVCIDDHSRLSYVEVLPDQSGATTASFLRRAFDFFEIRGIRVKRVMSDNGGCYRSRAVAARCSERSIRQVFIRPYTPRTNGKAERFIQTLLREWAYRFTYFSSEERTSLLPSYLHFYNHHRSHSSLGKLPPITRIGMNNLLRFDN